MRLILIRHGQTPNNVLNLLDTGVPGAGLTDLGRRQARAVPAALEGETPVALYVSTLTRTALTAQPLAAARQLHPVVRAGLREIGAGSLEMRGDAASLTAYQETVKSWLMGELDVRMPGGESGTEVLARFDAVVAELAATHPGQTVALVSHGAMIRFWAGHRGENIDFSDPRYYELSNTGIVVLAGEPQQAPGGWRIERWDGAPAGGVGGADFDGPTAELDADAQG